MNEQLFTCLTQLTDKGLASMTKLLGQPLRNDPSEVTDAAPSENGETHSTEEPTPGSSSKDGVNQRLSRKRRAPSSFSIRPGVSQFGLPPPEVPYRPNRRDRRAAAAAKSIQRQKTAADM